ncbi:MAG: S8 family serine peptidase [Oscillospiraceae bacterium]|jgi:subtilisin family serine protease|nr:S8 family serine peptidase [Oscillospiraceae bacterium]
MQKTLQFKKLTSVLLLLTVLLTICLPSVHTAASSALPQSELEAATYSVADIAEDFAADKALITIRHELSLEPPSLFTAEYLGIENVKYITPLFEDTRRLILAGDEDMGEVAGSFHQVLLVELAQGGKQQVLDLLERAEQSAAVLSASPDYILSESPDAYPFNDSFIGLGAFYDPYEQIKLYGAWEVSTGSSEVKVGVMDTGLLNSVDDTVQDTYFDVLSYTLDEEDVGPNVVGGYDFYNRNDIIADDMTGHGTGVASVIGAVGNNGKGIAGINHQVGLVDLQIADSSGGLSVAAQIIAYNWCNVNKIPIVNYSGSGTTYVEERSNAIANYYGLVCVTAGNNGEDLELFPRYPAVENIANMITVGGTNSSTGANQYNYSPNLVDIAAPATNIKTIHPFMTTMGYNKGECIADGTSFAAPMVAGTAALMLAVNPDLTAIQLKELLLSNATVKPQLAAYISGGRFLNVEAAVKAAVDYVPPTPPTIFEVNVDREGIRSVGEEIQFEIVATGGESESPKFIYIYKGGVVLKSVLDTPETQFNFYPEEQGTYNVRVYARDEHHNRTVCATEFVVE